MDNKRNTLLLTVIGVATLLVAVVGASFAYFTANITGGESTPTVTVGAGVLTIAYLDGDPALNATGILPQVAGNASITKDFTITGNNTTATTMPYTLTLVVQTNTFTTGALEYTLDSTNTGGNGQVAPTKAQTGIAQGASNIELGSGYFSGAVSSKVHTYVLKIYFEDTGVPQDEDKNKTFTGYVNTTVAAVTPTTTP